MKKWIVLSMFVVLLGGCDWLNKNEEVEKVEGGESEVSEEVGVSSIEDAIKRGIGVMCEYTDEDGENYQAFIKGSQVKINSVGAENELTGVLRGTEFYVWSPGVNQGLKIDFANSEGEISMGETPIKSVDDVIAKLQANVEGCRVTPVDESMFELPGGVEFSGSFLGD